MGFPGGSVVESKCDRRDPGDSSLIPGPGRSPGGGNGSPLWCSCLGSGQEELADHSPRSCKQTHLSDSARLYQDSSGHVPRGASAKDPTCHCRRCKRLGIDPWVGMMPCRAQQPTAIFLPGEFRGQRSLAGCSLRGRKASDTTVVT